VRIAGRRRGVRWISTLVLCFSAVAAPAAREYQTVDIQLLRITIDTDWAPRAAPGYFPARFEITNVGDARIIEIVGQASRAYRGLVRSPGIGPTFSYQSSTFVQQSIRMAMGDRVRLSIPIPLSADNENVYFEIRERNRVLHRFNYTSFQSRVAAKDASALVVAATGSPLRTIPFRTTRMTGSGMPLSIPRRGGAPTIVVTPSGWSGPATTLDFQLEPSRLPTNWLAYTSLRAVVIGPTEWEELTDGQKSALLAWTGSGGDLIFVDGDLKTLLPSAQPQPSTEPGRVTARYLFGRVLAVPLAALASGLTDLLNSTDPGRELQWALPANSAPDWGIIEKRGFRLRIPGIEGVPARVYLGILVLFSILIGPVNYWLLRRKRQQVLVVLTAPLISAIFIVLLAGYAIAGEGFRVLGRAVTFTMLDQVTKQAVTRATVSLYAPGLTPANGLRFGREIAVWAIGPDGSGVRDRMTLNLTDAQHFSAGVLQARSPTNFEQIAFRAARERLTFSPAEGGLSVTNGLDATILALSYRDGATMYRLDGRLSSGSRQTIKPAAFDPQSSPLNVPAKFSDLLLHQPPGSYLAVLEHSPFWEPGVARLSERGSVHVVLGWPEGQR
jgi:hypothetical protein